MTPPKLFLTFHLKTDKAQIVSPRHATSCFATKTGLLVSLTETTLVSGTETTLALLLLLLLVVDEATPLNLDARPERKPEPKRSAK